MATERKTVANYKTSTMSEIFSHYTHVNGEIRIYKNEEGYSLRSEFLMIVNVQWLDDSHVQLRGAHGKASTKIVLEVLRQCLIQGAELVTVKRKSGKKMPFGKLIKSGSNEDEYLIDLLQLKQRGLLHD